MTFFITLSAQASQLGCEDVIEFQVEQWISEGTRVNAVELDVEMEKYSVYTVRVGMDVSSPDLVGIPYVAVYKVLVDKVAPGTCAMVDSALVLEAH